MRGKRRLICFFLLLGVIGSLVLPVRPVLAADYYFVTQAQNPSPTQYSDETILVTLAWDYNGTRPIANVPVHTVWNYRTSTPTLDWHTGSDGRAAMTRNISDATIGFTVRVDIYVGDNQQQIDSAYFTPVGTLPQSQNSPPESRFYHASDQEVLDAANGCAWPMGGPPPPCSSAYVASSAPMPVFNPSQPVASNGPVSGSGGTCPAGYPVKANDNSGIYHVPGGQFYDATNAYNCFATEGAAQAAGYRKSLR